MSKFRTTKISQSYSSITIPLFWFVQTDEEERKSTESALNEVVDRLVSQRPELKQKEICGVSWLRNYVPSMEDIFDTAHGFEMGEGHVLGIDAQSIEDESLLVLHCINGKEPEIGRADRNEAIHVLLKDHLFKFTLAEVFDGRPWTRITVPTRGPEQAIEDDDINYTLPSHIPGDTKLQEEKITLFSLIKLTDEEISGFKQEIGDTANDITICNWPHETPASQAETYNIFQCMKPELVSPCDQTFVMFIDTTQISGPERALVVVVACESTPKDFDTEGRELRLDRMSYKHIYLHAVETQQVRELWPLIWHPPNQGSVNGVVMNYPLFYGNFSVSVLDWNSPVRRYPQTFIAKPRVPIRATGATSPRFVVYILCPVTSGELRILREIVVDANGDPLQFHELNLVPRKLRSKWEEETSQQLSVDFNTSLDPLLQFFDTPEYRAVADPPSTFVFLDEYALENLLAGESEHHEVPLAHLYYHYRDKETGDMSVVDNPAYLCSKVSIGDDLDSTLSNLEVGNMWFWELAGMHGGGMDVAFWPEYRGSMTREMLDIEDF